MGAGGKRKLLRHGSIKPADSAYAAQVGQLALNSAWAREALGRRCSVIEYLYAIGVIALMAAHWHDWGIAIKLIAPFGLFIVFLTQQFLKSPNLASEPNGFVYGRFICWCYQHGPLIESASKV